MNKKLLITGGAGFIGAHFVEHFLKETDWDIIVFDRLSYAASGFDRLRDIDAFDDKRVKIFTVDLNRPISVGVKQEVGDVDYILNLASESHVDRSISDPVPFIQNNINLILNMLEWAREIKGLKKFIQFSCHDKKTRVVTTNGLKGIDDIKVGDIVFTLNPKTRIVEEKPVKKVIIQDYSGDMIRFKNDRVDLLVTPNHRMYDDKMNVIEASEVKKRFTFPQPKGYDGNKKYSKDVMFLVGAFLGDGFTAYQEKEIISNKTQKRDKKTGRFYGVESEPHKIKTRSWRIFFDIPENDKARRRTEEALTRLGIKWHAEKGKAGEHIYFTSEKWVKFFNQFGKGADNKFIPREFLEQDKELLQAMFDGLIASDGYITKNGAITFTTISEGLRDGISEIAVKIGLIPQIRRGFSSSEIDGRKIEGWSYRMTFSRRNKSINACQGGIIEKEKYNDRIFSLQVDNKNYLVERNGSYIFSGNTDEVYGTAPEGVNYKEGSRYNPGNPYSASKASQEMIARAYSNTYSMPIVITNTMNVIGERQHPEKFVPLCIRKILKGETIPIHSNKDKTKSGTRFYIHARNVAKAIHFILTQNDEKLDKVDASKGKFNIVGEKEISNLDLAKFIAKVLGKPLKYEMVDFHSSRPGHDLRYSLDGSKLKKLGFEYPKSLEESLEKTIKWSIKPEHRKWIGL